jgi:hypothetical protein
MYSIAMYNIKAENLNVSKERGRKETIYMYVCMYVCVMYNIAAKRQKIST